jgi:hypothetical protein
MTTKFALTALAALAFTLMGAPMIASAHTATAGLGSSLSDSSVGQHGAHHRHHHHRHHHPH